MNPSVVQALLTLAYASMIEDRDIAIGRFLKALDENGTWFFETPASMTSRVQMIE